MKIQNYCYTRGVERDYRNFIVPSILSASDIEVVSNLVKPILACEFTPNTLDTQPPIWILYKTSNVLVWGCCCWNRVLSSLNQCNTDEKERQVRGFFSIVISDYAIQELKVPYDLSYFEKLYENEIVPHWFCGQGEKFSSSGSGFYNGSYRFISASENEYRHLLNTDIFLSKRLGVSNVEEVIESALTLDTITLAIGYDGTDGISNTNALFMNSIMPGKKEKSVPVKHACPSCGKLVSHYTSSGMCDECSNLPAGGSTIIAPIQYGNMENKEQELTELKRQVRDYRLEIDEKDKKIKKQNRQIRIFWIVCGILLLLSLWFFKNSDIKIDTSLANRQSTYQEKVADEHQEPDFFLDVDSQKVEVMAEGQDNVVVGWRTNYPNVEVKMSDVDWAEITDSAQNHVILSVKDNRTSNVRLAQIMIKPRGGQETIVEIYQKSAE